MPYDSDLPPAIKVEELWIAFKATRERQSIRSTVVGFRERAKRSMLVEALRGVSFEVETCCARSRGSCLPPTEG